MALAATGNGLQVRQASGGDWNPVSGVRLADPEGLQLKVPGDWISVDKVSAFKTE
jgi:hypothetical protein